jgi:hypothetical protein
VSLLSVLFNAITNKPGLTTLSELHITYWYTTQTNNKSHNKL